VKRGEKVTVDIPVHVVGEAANETLVNLDLNTLSVEAEATHIPTGVDVSIDGMGVGDQVHASDVKLPSGVTLATDPDALVVNITAAPTAEQLEAELAEAEAEVGIVHEPSEEERAEVAAGEAGAGEGAAGAEAIGATEAAGADEGEKAGS
jgi:large subunit ribosomal protein L25